MPDRGNISSFLNGGSAVLINTPLQRGERKSMEDRNRFNGFGRTRKTVETVSWFRPLPVTPLKRGVNESRIGERESSASYET